MVEGETRWRSFLADAHAARSQLFCPAAVVYPLQLQMQRCDAQGVPVVDSLRALTISKSKAICCSDSRLTLFAAETVAGLLAVLTSELKLEPGRSTRLIRFAIGECARIRAFHP